MERKTKRQGRESRLRPYRGRRRFDRTAEPVGQKRRRASKAPFFVVQKHDATTLHYDFPLEVDGVLKSWAVPKGPSTDPREKRLAVPTEDHPIEYADFEGVIPEGEYGAGTVLVWEKGTYRNLTKDKNGKVVPLARALTNGHVAFSVRGNKLRGGYAFTRFKKCRKARWLLLKMDDEGADARRNPVRGQPESVLTGRTIEEIAEENEAEDGT